jgi:hypothetical protein
MQKSAVSFPPFLNQEERTEQLSSVKISDTPVKMYIIKIKGKAKIPDYIQLRNDDFVLVAYFRADRELKNLEKYGLGGKEEMLAKLISELPFGKLQLLDL